MADGTNGDTGLRPLCFVLMPFGSKDDPRAARSTSTRSTRRSSAPRSRTPACSASGRTRSGWADHPQADVRTSAAVRVRRGGPDDGQRERLLRARDPARDAYVEHRAAVPGRVPVAVRRRVPAGPALPPRRHGRPRPVHESSDRAALAAKLRTRTALRHGQPGVPVARRASATGHQQAADRSVPRTSRGGDGAARAGSDCRREGRHRRDARRAPRTRRARRHRDRADDRPPAVLSRSQGL